MIPSQSVIVGAMPCDAEQRIGVAFDQHGWDYQTNYGDYIWRYPNIKAGWYYDYTIHPFAVWEQGIDYRYHMVWSVPKKELIEALVENHPDDVLIIGNEPDVTEQQNMSPTEYARFFHETLAVVRSISPDYRVAIAGVSKGTPDRIDYLQAVLDAYSTAYEEKMPVDVWTIHLYHYAPSQLEALQEQILAVRQLMQSNGYQDRPLIVTEFVGDAYYMVAGFDWLLRAQAPSGLPTDDSRLVQGAAWFSLTSYKEWPYYLYDKKSTQPTAMAAIFNNLLSRYQCAEQEVAQEKPQTLYLPLIGN